MNKQEMYDIVAEHLLRYPPLPFPDIEVEGPVLQSFLHLLQGVEKNHHPRMWGLALSEMAYTHTLDSQILMDMAVQGEVVGV